MILIFDLDDTLYDEMSFVLSGFRAVAHYGETSYGWDAGQSETFMQEHLLRYGRGRVFDEWLRYHGRYSSTRVTTCVRVYRHHQPEIELFPIAARLLKQYQGQSPLYLVTDGHKVAQYMKIKALKLAPMFRRIFITRRFGIRHEKPSLHCFEIIRRMERCDWSEMVYVGDNPAKDFVSLNPMGALTVRVRTGSHASATARRGHDARVTIADLAMLPMILDEWSRGREMIRGRGLA